MSDQRIEGIRKMMAFIKEVLQFAFVVVLAIAVVGAVAKPSWARGELVRLGIEIKEFNLGVVKFAVAQSMSASAAVAEAQAKLTDAQAALKPLEGDSDASRSLDEAVKRLASARTVLDEKEAQLKKLQRDAGLQPDVPRSAWITVGLLGEPARLMQAAKIDKAQTVMAGNTVKTVGLKYDAIVRTDDECAPAIDSSDALAPTEAEKQKLVLLVRAGAYKAEETHLCPTRTKGTSLVSARIALTDASVRLAQFQNAKD